MPAALKHIKIKAVTLLNINKKEPCFRKDRETINCEGGVLCLRAFKGLHFLPYEYGGYNMPLSFSFAAISCAISKPGLSSKLVTAMSQTAR